MAVVAGLGGWGALERADPLSSCLESDSSALETPTQFSVAFLMEQKSIELCEAASWSHMQNKHRQIAESL